MKKLTTIILVICTLLLSACSPIKMPPKAKYTIMNFQQPANQYKPKTKLTLLVTTPGANPGYETSKMLYMIVPLRLQAFSKHRWIAPPNQMLLPIIVNALRNTHYFYAVASSPFAGNTNYRLDTKILALQQEFFHPISQVRLIIQATLINNQSNQVIATQIFSAIKPTQMNNPYGGVLTTRQIANLIAKQVASFTWHHVR